MGWCCPFSIKGWSKAGTGYPVGRDKAQGIPGLVLAHWYAELGSGSPGVGVSVCWRGAGGLGPWDPGFYACLLLNFNYFFSSFMVLLTQIQCEHELSIHFLPCAGWHWDLSLRWPAGLLFSQWLCGSWRRLFEQSQHSKIVLHIRGTSSSLTLWTRNFWKLLGSMCFVFWCSHN